MSEAAAPSGLQPLAAPLGLRSDEHLVRRASQGDERAFAAIFRRYHQDLYRFSLAIVGNSHDAQDALQNTMLKVMRALPGEDREIQLKPWLYRIAHNESIEVLRRRSAVEELDPLMASAALSLADGVEQRARLRRLLADVEELPERQRGALVMRELAGLGFEEIAAALGTSAAVARQTLYEARLSLRQMEEGRELSCDAVARVLSDADGRVVRRRDIRAHLRECEHCRAFRDEIRRRRGDFRALGPLPAAAAAAILQGIAGAGSSGGGGAVAGATGAGAAAGKAAGLSAIGGATLAKGVATVAVVAAVGVGAADRAGVIDVGLRSDASKQGSTHPGSGSGAGTAAPAERAASAGAEPAQGVHHVGAAGAASGRVIGDSHAHRGSGAGHPQSPGTEAAPVSAAGKGNSHSAAGHGHGALAEPGKGHSGRGSGGPAESYGAKGNDGGQGNGASHGKKGEKAANPNGGGNGNKGGNGNGAAHGNRTGYGKGGDHGDGPSAAKGQSGHPPKAQPPPAPAQASGQEPSSDEEASAGPVPADSSLPESAAEASHLERPQHPEHPVHP